MSEPELVKKWSDEYLHDRYHELNNELFMGKASGWEARAEIQDVMLREMSRDFLDMVTERNALLSRVVGQDNTWLAMLREVAALADTIDSDGEWVEADDATLLEQLDPWQVLRKAKARIASLEAEKDLLLKLLNDMGLPIEGIDIQINGEEDTDG